MRGGNLILTGSVARRQFYGVKVCEENHGHQHNYPHVTRCRVGRVRVTQYGDTQREVILSRVELGPEESVEVKELVFHDVKVLETPHLYECEFDHRDFGGKVIETYQGNVLAYE